LFCEDEYSCSKELIEIEKIMNIRLKNLIIKF